MRIEDRRRRVWPWVVGLLLLMLLIWALAFQSGREDGVKVRNDATRIGAVHSPAAPAAPAPTAGREVTRPKSPGTEAEARERVLRMRSRMIA
jgi:hypothetical protein